MKSLAQSDISERVALAQIELADQLFKVHERGSKLFSFVIQNNSYRISLAKLGALRAPLAYVQISSELLTKKPLLDIVTELSTIINLLGNVSEEAAISRVDLCADFTTDYHLFDIEDSDWVTRADDIQNHSNKRRYTGTTIGAGGDVSARLYNKTVEMQKKPRLYLQDLHRLMGWDEKRDIWRLEFQFKRDFLRELDIRYVSDLESSLAGLWQYATVKWLRHTIPNDFDSTQSRWPVSEWWLSMQTADWGEGEALSRKPLDKGHIPSDRTLFVNGISGFTSFMAREGVLDPYEAITAYLSAAKQYHDNREHITGLGFFDYISQKVALKMREFGTHKNISQDSDSHPADKAVADAYRKYSDGE
ncbi:MAG TPA: hypothetical protein ENI26_01425 [Methylophaga aminisulfidivorans]|uniref:Replication initiation factor n=1 Tax=Methylophaga aminisulfidivorans TaxID=230105 RepID=A0A7C2A9R7_9GAMM|nr:hypothetical protein [Methylophaga aminisulfidivorans]